MADSHGVIIEKTDTGYSAYVPDLPGCIAAAETLEETELLIREAVEIHLDGLAADAVAERIRNGEERALSSEEFWRAVEE